MFLGEAAIAEIPVSYTHLDVYKRQAQNSLCNIVTIMLGTTLGATAEGKTFLAAKTILVIVIGRVAFAFSTAGGVLFGKLMNLVTHGKVNPLIGSAGDVYKRQIYCSRL